MNHHFPKTILTILCCSVASVLFACSKSSENPSSKGTGGEKSVAPGTISFPDSTGEDKLFAIKSGIIQSDVTIQQGGRTIVGHVTQYFDDYGMKQCTEYSQPVPGTNDTSKTVQIVTDSLLINYDAVGKTGSKFIGKIGANATANNVVRALYLPDSTRKTVELKQLENKEVLGKQCTGYSITTNGITTKAWIWKKVPMYTEQIADTNKWITQTTAVQTDIQIPPDKFTAPADIKLSVPNAPVNKK